jgi:peptide/nickel transport system permease protein
MTEAALRVTAGAAAPARRQVPAAGPWRLMWWRFRRHRLAVAGGIVILLFYFIALFAEFFAPFPPNQDAARYTFAPPQTLHLFGPSWQLSPHVEGFRVTIDPMAMRRVFRPDPSAQIPVGFFVYGAPYRLWGLIPADIHLIGPLDPTQPMYLFGADRLGRDVLSRLIYGARVSLSIGLVGVTLSLLLGILLGGLSGLYGGWVDTVIQRVIEMLRSIPTIPLWMGLTAAIPLTVPPLEVYFIITLILSLVGWTSVARVVRGRFISLRTEDFIAAARLDGAGTWRIILRHMVPSFASHIIATVSLTIPGMILAETALSFLGVGLHPPIVSWGVMLQDAQNIRAVASAQWLLWPGAMVAITVLAFNFLGDGLRDAADPYDN